MTDPLSNPKNFLFKTWRSLGLPDPSPLQYDFMEYINDHRAWQQVREEGSIEVERGVVEGARKILMAFRGAAKTFVATTNSVYLLRENPLEEVLVVSATDNFASAISTMAFKMVTEFEWLAPDMAPSTSQRQSALSFDVRGARQASKDASFTARGIFGQITGLRASKIIGDDLETPNTAETELKRTNLRYRMSELGGAVIKPGGDILLLGTAHAEQTVYKEYAEEKGYEMRVYPLVYPQNEKERMRLGTRLAPMLATSLDKNPLLAGTSTEPSRFTERDIMKRETEYGRTEFERQFRMFLDAGADRLYPLKLRDLVVIDMTPPSPATGGQLQLPSKLVWNTLRDHRVRDIQLDSLTGDGAVYYPLTQDLHLPAEQVICHVDPSGEGDDETSWSILAGLAGRVYLCKQGASLDGHSETTLKRIAADCAEWNVQIVRVEKNFGQGMFSSLLRPQLTAHGCRPDIEDLSAGNLQKEKRIVNTLEPLITSHRLVVNASVLRDDFTIPYQTVEEVKRRFYRLTYQLSRITTQRGALRHDDRVDSLAGGCAHFADRLQRALAEEEQFTRDELMQKEIDKHVEARLEAGLPTGGIEDAPRDNRRTGHQLSKDPRDPYGLRPERGKRR